MVLLGICMLIAVVLLFALYALYSVETLREREVSWSKFVSCYLRPGLVKRVEVVNGRWARVVTTRGSNVGNVWLRIASAGSFEQKFDREVRERNLNVELVFKSELELADLWAATVTVMKMIPTLIFLGLAIFTLVALMTTEQKSTGEMLTGNKKPLLQNHTAIQERFSDIVGCEQAKAEISELVHFLKYPHVYAEMGAKIPRGALLVGPPGTGKTFLARAVAGEAGVPFIYMAGPEFNEIFMGMGALKMRELFGLARENQPCIIFIDEIDSIGRQRHAEFSSSSEADNTLNQLLVLLDGFSSKDKIIVLAATNREDMLDSALLRPGRFDRKITVPVPDKSGREAIFKKYLSTVHLDVSLKKDLLAKMLADMTPGFTGADIANVCNEAAILATRCNQCAVEMSNFEEAIDRAVAGAGSPSVVLTPDERQKVAYHEAGHAVAGWFSKHADPLVKVTILPRGSSLGHTRFCKQEIHLYTQEQLTDLMVVMMAGRSAEEIFFGKTSSGASDDLNKVTSIAYETVMTWGMNAKLGPVSYSKERKLPLSEEFAKVIDSEVQSMISKVEKEATALLKLHKEDVTKIAEALLKRDTLSAEEVKKLVGPRPFELEKGVCNGVGDNK